MCAAVHASLSSSGTRAIPEAHDGIALLTDAADDHAEEFPQLVRRTPQLAHAVPRVIRAREQQAVIAEEVRRRHRVECLERGSGVGPDPVPIVEDERRAPPLRIPVVRGVEVEEVCAKLVRAVAVGRHRTAGRRVEPVEAQGDLLDPEHPRQEAPVWRLLELVEEFLPRRRELGALAVPRAGSGRADSDRTSVSHRRIS